MVVPLSSNGHLGFLEALRDVSTLCIISLFALLSSLFTSFALIGTAGCGSTQYFP